MVVEKVVKGIWRVIDMTIDEAIEKESKIAKENQKIVDTQIVFDNVSISELYCDDTEVIEEHLSNYRKCAEYHKQIADWLEELVMLRLDSCMIHMPERLQLVENGYNKALDDFVQKVKEHQYVLSDVINSKDYGMFTVGIEQIAEQLKAGGMNEYNI